MTYNTYKSEDSLNLIDEFFELKFSKSTLPFESRLLPLGKHLISYTHKGTHKVSVDDEIYNVKDISISGQTKKSYLLNINEETECYGIRLHPTALYKLTQLDVSIINDKHIPLSEFSKPLYNTLNTFFAKKLKHKEALIALELLFKELPVTINRHTDNVDNALAIIMDKKGKISINDLLEKIPVSQKTLETKFKLMVGLTPKKYARLYRFSMLMKKYNEKELKFRDLVEMYNFHDGSHFSKEFKYFMNESPKAYFKNESELIKKYLK